MYWNKKKTLKKRTKSRDAAAKMSRYKRSRDKKSMISLQPHPLDTLTC